jgi:hypothetical protein
MKYLLYALGVLIAIPVLFFAIGFSHRLLNTQEIRYRLTAEFETPDGVRSGASVIKGTSLRPLSFDPFQYTTWKTEGEAVFVDLKAGKNAIMLLAGGDAGLETLWGRAYGLTNGQSYDAWNGKHRDRIKGVAVLERELVLTIVTFTDINDPASAKVLRDQADYVQSLGEGYSFRRATLEVVPNTTPLTRGIEGKLPWVQSTPGYLSGKTTCNANFENCLDVGDFRKH